MLQWNAPLPPRGTRRRGRERTARKLTFDLDGDRTVVGNQRRPVDVTRLERVLDEQTTKARAVDEEIGLQPIAFLEDDFVDHAVFTLRNTADVALQSHDTEMFRALAAAIGRHHPDATVVPTPIPYGTDSNAFRHKGAKSYGILPIVLSSSIVASMHSDAERIPVDQIETGIRVFYEALLAVAGR